MENTWLAWAKRLQSIASTGISYSEDPYDRIRYEEVAGIAHEMLAAIGNVPIDRIHNLVSDFAQGYATPKVDVRGAVIRDDQILLVREASDGLWTLPGGFADVGRSASENIAKEIWEEAGIRVDPQGLYGIRHKAKHEYLPDARDFYKLFFVCRQIDNTPPSAGLETTDVGFFGLAELPALSTGRVLEKDLVAAFDFATDPTRLALFD